MDLGHKERDYSCEAVSPGMKKDASKMKTVYPSFRIGNEYGPDNQGSVNLPIDSSDINKEIRVTAIIVPKEVMAKSGEKGSKRCYSFEVKSIEFPKRDPLDEKRSRTKSIAAGLSAHNKGDY